MNALIIAYLSVAVTILLLHYPGFLLSMRRHTRRAYRQKLLPRFNSDYTPTVAVFMPCKGICKHFAKNVSSLLATDYPNYNAYFIVEADTDPAHDVLKRLTAGRPRAHIVIAGESQINGQKNHNLLKGIEASRQRDEAYVFLDADIAFDRNWIRNLVQPLSDESVTCATGFRLVSLSEGGIARCVHTFMVTMQWAWMHFKPIRTVWGGSVAIRRHEFEGLKIADSWRNTVVDDISLTQRVSAARTKVQLVPLCVAETDDAITSLRGTFEWFRRQSQFIKYYMRPAWLIAIFTYSFVSLSMLALPFLIFACTYCPQPNVIVLTSSVGVLSVLFMLWALLSRDKKSNTYNGVLWFLMSPFCFAVASFSGAAGGFSDTVTWSGVAYKVGFRGTVKKITRI